MSGTLGGGAFLILTNRSTYFLLCARLHLIQLMLEPNKVGVLVLALGAASGKTGTNHPRNRDLNVADFKGIRSVKKADRSMAHELHATHSMFHALHIAMSLVARLRTK